MGKRSVEEIFVEETFCGGNILWRKRFAEEIFWGGNLLGRKYLAEEIF